jgi:hypothetical protein
MVLTLNESVAQRARVPQTLLKLCPALKLGSPPNVTVLVLNVSATRISGLQVSEGRSSPRSMAQCPEKGQGVPRSMAACCGPPMLKGMEGLDKVHQFLL